MDVSRITGFPVKGLERAEGPEADKARRAAENMVEQAKNDPNCNQILGPTGCWNQTDGEWKELKTGDPKNDRLIAGHKDHFHINVFRK